MIYIVEDLSESSSGFSYTYNASTETFVPKDDSQQMIDGKDYFAVKGERQTYYFASVADGKSIVKLELRHSANDATGLPALPLISDVFTADATGTVATMHHLCGVVEVPIKLSEATADKGVTSFSIYVSGGKLSGDFTATPSSPYISDTSTGYDTAKSEEKETAYSAGTTTSVFIPVLPGTYTGVSLNYYHSTGSGYKSFGSDKTLVVERGKITKITLVEI